MLENLAWSVQNATDRNFWIGFTILIAITCGLLYVFLRNLKHARLIEDTPTSMIRSAAQGFVELEGFGQQIPDTPIISPLTGTACIWWRYQIQKKVRTNKSTRWQTVESRDSDSLFLLIDQTGSCIVDPENAKVTSNRKKRWHGNSRWPSGGSGRSFFSFGGSYRYIEEWIAEDSLLYTLGHFQTQRAEAGHFDESSEVNALMREWKQNHKQLLQRFDVNKDGQIDSKEWEAARRVAIKRVREMNLERNTLPGLHVLAQTPDSKPFVISTTPQEDLIKRYQRNSFFCVTGFLFCMAAVAWTLSVRGLL